MVMIMDIDTGKFAGDPIGNGVEDEFGAFEVEVLNAEWLPQPELQLAGSHTITRTPSRVPAAQGFDADAFLRNVYLVQE